MTIDRNEFAAGMGILAGAFGREADTAIIRAYYAVLSPKITTAEFQHAVQRALETETYWPSPAVLLQKVQGTSEDAGEAALRHVNATTSRHGGYQFLPYAVYQAEFDPPTRAAIQAVGGLREIAHVTEDRYPSLRRKFAAAYAKACGELPAVPAVPSVPLLVRETESTRERQLPARDD